MEVPVRKKRRTTLYCGHCNKYVSRATFYRHKTQFFNQFNQSWYPAEGVDTATLSRTRPASSKCDSDVVLLSSSEDDDLDINYENLARHDDSTSQCRSPTSNYEDNEAFFSQLSDSSLSDDAENIRNMSKSHVDDIFEEMDSDASSNYDGLLEHPGENHSLSSLVWKLIWFLFFWQSVFNISERALEYVIRFLKYFLGLLAIDCNSQHLRELSKEVPETVRRAVKLLGLNDEEVIEYVVCPKCHSVYEYEDCVITHRNGKKESKLCSYVKYPLHPQLSRRKQCHTLLLKSAPKNRLVPFLTYSYHPISLSLQRLAARPGFLSLCEKWRQRESTIPVGYYGDIFDGAVWKRFNQDFLRAPYSYLLTINIDWFQPFKNTQHSVGAIYLIIQNLPREHRFKEENIMLVGVIPGPQEPSLSVDSYILPLVEELKRSFSEGIPVVSCNGTSIKIRAMLSCVSCDIPATRKLCGFLSHNAKLGCNKCYKQFNVMSKQTDFSGFNRALWEPRTAEKHRSDCLKIQSCVTKSAVRLKESELGVRPCALLNLPNYDPIQFVAIDIMHNLFLVTAKHMFSVWVDMGLLSKPTLQLIDQMASKFVVPGNIGRLPVNISSNYSSFKAAQWSSWTLIYSPVVLKNILPDNHYSCWLLYVRACAIISKRIITESDINTADNLLVTYCKKVKELYGAECCTPNMHLHLHLKQTLLDFGPAHATWCYSFERFNGILGSIKTNKKSPEIQFMRKFLRNQAIHFQSSTLSDDEFIRLLPPPTSTGSILQLPVSCSCTSDGELINLLKLSHAPLEPHLYDYSDKSFIKVLGKGKEAVFTSSELDELINLYQQLNPGYSVQYATPFYVRYGKVSIGGDVLGSVLHGASAQSSSVIAAYWPNFGNSIEEFDHSRASIGKVQYYFCHSITLKETHSEVSKIVNYTFAYSHWMNYHHQNSIFGISATVCANSTKEPSMFSIIPVLRISAKCASCLVTLNDETTFVACPIPLKLSI